MTEDVIKEFKAMIDHAIDNEELQDIRRMILESSDVSFVEASELTKYLELKAKDFLRTKPFVRADYYSSGKKSTDYQMRKVMFSSKRLDHGTPEDIFRQLDEEFHFTLDVCADSSNAMVKRFLTAKDDALRVPWANHICWMNPPYGREIPKWINKAFHESQTNNATVVCLVPARTDTNWFWDYCVHGEIRLIKGRLRFKGESSSAPFPSMIVVFRPHAIQTTKEPLTSLA